MAPATITTVIPTYQRPRQLRAAIETALAQTYPHVKVLVCDNASGDETAEVVGEIQRRDPRVVYHCHKTNIGPMENHFVGLGSEPACAAYMRARVGVNSGRSAYFVAPSFRVKLNNSETIPGPDLAV